MFLVAYGKIGGDFIDQVRSHNNDWYNSSDNCHVSLKVIFVLLAGAFKNQGQSLKLKIIKTPWLGDLSCGAKARLANYYGNVGIFKVELENC